MVNRNKNNRFSSACAQTYELSTGTKPELDVPVNHFVTDWVSPKKTATTTEPNTLTKSVTDVLFACLFIYVAHSRKETFGKLAAHLSPASHFRTFGPLSNLYLKSGQLVRCGSPTKAQRLGAISVDRGSTESEQNQTARNCKNSKRKACFSRKNLCL
jgi:hypothetical protein